MRGRRDYRDRHHFDRHRDSAWNHKPDPGSRRPRRSMSPPVRHRRERSLERRENLERYPVHRRYVHQDHIPVHLPRAHHPFTVRSRQYDFPPMNHEFSEYPPDLNQDYKHKPRGLEHEPRSPYKSLLLDDGLGRSYQPPLKQDSMLGGILTDGFPNTEHRAHLRDLYDENGHTERDMERTIYARETPLTNAVPTSRTERNHYTRNTPPPGTIPISHYTRNTPLSGTVPTCHTEREREKTHYTRDTQLSGMVPTSRTDRGREKTHYMRDAPLSGTVPTSRTDRDREKTNYTRDTPLSGTVPTSHTERERERGHCAKDTPISNTIPISRTERGRERNHYTRDTTPPSNAIPISHLRPIEGGPSSYPGLYHDHTDHAYAKQQDNLINRRDLASEETYKKMPYPSLDCDDDYSSRNARVFMNPVHSKHGDVGPMHMHHHGSPFDDVMYNELQHRDGPCMASYRDGSESPMFFDRGKGMYIPPRDDFVDDMDYDRSMARRHHVHFHQHEGLYHVDHDNDIDNDDDSYGYVPRRVSVKERIVERDVVEEEEEEEEETNNVRERMGRPFTSKKMGFGRGKYRESQNMTYHAKSIKKRLRPALPDSNRIDNGGFNKPQKYPKRVLMEEVENENENEDEKEVPHGENGEIVSLKREASEGSEEFKREVEKAFIKYARIINGSVREKKKYLEPGRGSLGCYVCGSESKTFAETHNLVVHTYHTKKPGLRTAHLGFQKALCLLMGWNWLLVPDESRTYQINPPGEAKFLKQDLLLWPPFVVICNSSIVSKSPNPIIVSIPEIQNFLKGIGIGEEKGKVSYGKPSNQSVFLVKFEPTLPGYELAKNLHDYFSDKNRGKEYSDGSVQNGESGTKIEDVLYGYMAGIEDLDKLDGTKVHVRSKRREIEAPLEKYVTN